MDDQIHQNYPGSPCFNGQTSPGRKSNHLCVQSDRSVVEAYGELAVVGTESLLLYPNGSQEQLVRLLQLALWAKRGHDGKHGVQTFRQGSLSTPTKPTTLDDVHCCTIDALALEAQTYQPNKNTSPE